MKKILIFTCLLLSLSLTGSVLADLLIDLDAGDLAVGTTRSWGNNGSSGGQFDLWSGDTDLVVEEIEGVRCVTFSENTEGWDNTGGNVSQALVSSFATPAGLTGSSPFTVEVLAYNPDVGDEEVMVNWAKRGTNTRSAQFNYGTNGGYGAASHYGIAMGWDPLPPAGQWQYLIVTYTGGTDGVETVYVNGISNNNSQVQTLDLWPDGLIYIGCAMEGNETARNLPYNGSLAYVKMHDRALSASEIGLLAGKFTVAGSLSPESLELTEGETGNITLQLDENYMTNAGPTSDLEITLSFVDAGADVKLGTSAVGEPYVITVPMATYDDPIVIPIVAEDDAVLEGTHFVEIQAVVTGGDADYMAASINPPILPVRVLDDDFTPYAPEYSNGYYIDNFDNEWDFGLGLAGFWDGFMNAEAATHSNTLDMAGWLTLGTAAGWGFEDTSGPFLYVELTGDFVAELKMGAPQSSAGGLLVRLADKAVGGAGEDNMWFASWSDWGVGSIFWPVDNDNRMGEYAISWDEFDGPRWMRVERQGASFYWSRSYDGVNWEGLEDASPFVREDMNVDTLQVGICQAWDGSGPVEFDYFRYTPVRGSISGTLHLTESIGQAGTVELQLDTEGFPAPTADIDITISAVAAPGADPNSDPNDILIGTSAKAESYSFTILAANYDQPQTIDIAAFADTIIEPEDQQLTLQVDVSSVDSDWNGLKISSLAEINVYEYPGLIVDTGDGVEATEGGTDGSFTVRLKTVPTAPVSVAIAEDPAQATVVASVSLNSGNFMTPQVVTVEAVDDTVLEGDPHTTELTLTPSNGAEYDLAASSVEVSILENDCGAWGYNSADFDKDCDVDIADLAELALNWLDCSNPYDPGCVDYR